MQKKSTIVGLLLIPLLLAAAAHAQIRSATITGTVTDPTGAVVPRAQVIVTEEQTGVEYKTETTDAGLYTVPYLPAGTYRVVVTAPGFSEYRQTGIAVSVAQSVKVDVSLKVGALGQAIEVVAMAAQLQTTSSTVSGAVQSQMIDVLPNINPTSAV